MVLVHKSLESRLRKSSEGLVWVEFSEVGRKMMVGEVYINPEGMRVGKTESLLEVLQVDVAKYVEEDFDVMGISTKELDWEQRNFQIVMR